MLIEISEEEREVVAYALKEYQSGRLLEPRSIMLLEFRRRLMNLKPVKPFSKAELNKVDRLLADAISEAAEVIKYTCCAAESEMRRRLHTLRSIREKLLQFGSAKEVGHTDLAYVEHRVAEMYSETQDLWAFNAKLNKLKQGLKELADAI